MPKLLPNQSPTYRRHKQSGQAIVTLSGRDHLLGEYGSTASRSNYDRLVAEWIAGGRQAVEPSMNITVTEVIAAFWKHAQAYYRDAAGGPTSEISHYHYALKPLRRLYGRTSASAFGPLALKAVRSEMIRLGWSRTRINKLVSRIRHVFKWAAENEMISGSICHSLAAVAGLQKNRCDARESKPVRPVAESHARAVLPFVAPPVAAMIELQLLTGARPGEILMMRAVDLDTTGTLWVYRPDAHKTAHHGHAREIYLGPRARAIVEPYLTLDPSEYLFSPAKAESARRAAAHSARKTPLSWGNVPGSNRVPRPQRSPGQRYTVTSYRRAIARACELAFPPAAPLAKLEGETLEGWKARLTLEQRRDLAAWRRSHRWHPHQLRHTAGTLLRKEFGLEAAQVILGHKTLTVTQVYAEKNVAAAQEIMSRVG